MFLLYSHEDDENHTSKTIGHLLKRIPANMGPCVSCPTLAIFGALREETVYWVLLSARRFRLGLFGFAIIMIDNVGNHQDRNTIGELLRSSTP